MSYELALTNIFSYTYIKIWKNIRFHAFHIKIITLIPPSAKKSLINLQFLRMTLLQYKLFQPAKHELIIKLINAHTK